MLSAVSIVHVERGTVLSCDDFQLVGKTTVNTESITILLNNTLANQVENVFDVQKQMKAAQARHQILPIVSSSDVDKIITMLEQTKKTTFSNIFASSIRYSSSTYIYLLIIINVAVVVLVCCLCKGWITCPLISRLIIRKIPTTDMQSTGKEQDIDLNDYYEYQLKRKKNRAFEY